MNENASNNIPTAGAALASHERWCNREEHAKIAAEGFGPYGCVGSLLEVSGEIMGQAPGGWWVQHEPGARARFALDWNLKFGELSVDELRFAHRLLLSLGRAQIDTALELVTAALTEYDGQHPADAEDEL